MLHLAAGLSSGSQTVDVNLGVGDRKIVSVNYATTLASAAAVDVLCVLDSAGAALANEVCFTAIKVGSVTQQ
ncbi:MAG TPA: hypothetical protein VFI54_06510 [Solirubrobacteraceae bacterium]|nr:hypothetical protein [Solirubrobacteraceae bacterium]